MNWEPVQQESAILLQIVALFDIFLNLKAVLMDVMEWKVKQ